MKNRGMMLVMAAVTVLQTVATVPAMADYSDYVRHQQRKAARQATEARIDAMEGRYGAARMHERKAFRDAARANWGGGWHHGRYYDRWDRY
ncbi:MAG: hypothetical protein K2X81_05310 [Candidatus Obscuribacterales bacterium]|nr:hypothetical protein [Candidatus Obscuribacterales bacterium]